MGRGVQIQAVGLESYECVYWAKASILQRSCTGMNACVTYAMAYVTLYGAWGTDSSCKLCHLCTFLKTRSSYGCECGLYANLNIKTH